MASVIAEFEHNGHQLRAVWRMAQSEVILERSDGLDALDVVRWVPFEPHPSGLRVLLWALLNALERKAEPEPAPELSQKTLGTITRALHYLQHSLDGDSDVALALQELRRVYP